MKHFAPPAFWDCYRRLLETVQPLEDKNFDLLKSDSHHPSLRLKRTGRFWSVRVGLHHRALGADGPEGTVWFWIGSHAEYDAPVGRSR